jgi:hypothetical protein
MTEDRGFRWDVEQALTREWLAEGGKGEPLSPLAMPTLRVINEFMDEKIGRALKERDPLRAFRAMADLHAVLSDLVKVGRNDFEPLLRIADDTMAGAVKMMRDHLVKRYLDPSLPEEMAAEINATLVEIVSRGAWPNWQQDAVWQGALDEIDAPIQPWAC